MTNEVLPALTHHSGTDVCVLLAALNGRVADLPAEAFNELAAHNQRLIENPSSEVEATLRRQIVLLEGVEHAFLRKAASALRPDHAAAYAQVAIKAGGALLQVLGALKAMNDGKRKAPAIEG